MNATALYTADKCEVWCGTQMARRFAATLEASELPAEKMRRQQAAARRRFRPARPDRLCAAGRADRQADAGHADQAAVDARRGHDARRYHPITQCKLTAGFDADNNLTPSTCGSPASPSLRACGRSTGQRMDPATLPVSTPRATRVPATRCQSRKDGLAGDPHVEGRQIVVGIEARGQLALRDPGDSGRASCPLRASTAA